MKLSAPMHADLDAICLEDSCKFLTGKLVALVCIEYLWASKRLNRFFKCFNTEAAFQCIGNFPGQHFTIMPIRHSYKTHKPTWRWNIYDISTPPHLVRLFYCHVALQIRICFMFRAWPVSLWIDLFKTHLSNQSLDTLSIYLISQSLENITDWLAPIIGCFLV